MTYRINGQRVTREEFLKTSKGFDFSASGVPQVIKDYEGYDCPITGKWIEGRAAHRENLKRTGCRLLEKGEREQVIRNKERSINESAERATNQFMEIISREYHVS